MSADLHRTEVGPALARPASHSGRGRRTAVSIAGVILLACTLASCGGSEITSETVCSDYLDHDASERHDAAVRISSEMGTTNAGNPMWGMSLDGACGGNRDMTLGEYFDRAR